MSSNDGVYDFLNFMITDGKGGYTFRELEEKFGIEPYNDLGNRAKKLWRRFEKSNLSVDDYIAKISKKESDLGTGVIPVTGGESKEWKFSNNNESAYFAGVTEKSITKLEEVLDFAEVDLNSWDVKDWTWKSWDVTMKIKRTVKDDTGKTITYHEPIKRTNYAVKVWLVRKSDSEELYNNILEEVSSYISKKKIRNVKGSGVGVVSLADFHIGAEVTNLITTTDFNIDKIVEYLDDVAEVVNDRKYSEVHVNMLGDYFESISGLNHLNTFKSLMRGGHGASVIKLAGVIITEFLSKINNLKSVNMVSGNHDRITISKTVDNEGAGAELLAHIIELKMPTIEVNYHSYCLTKEFDGIGYVLTHGHFSMNKKSSASIIQRYGIDGKYNLWLEGHLHTRKTVRTWVKKPVIVEDELVVSIDDANYRKLTVPSVFTGNFYSETLGFTTSGGFIISENNGKGKPHVFDYSL